MKIDFRMIFVFNYLKLNDYIEHKMPNIKEMAERMKEKKVEWLLLNEFFAYRLEIGEECYKNI